MLPRFEVRCNHQRCAVWDNKHNRTVVVYETSIWEGQRYDPKIRADSVASFLNAVELGDIVPSSLRSDHDGDRVS